MRNFDRLRQAIDQIKSQDLVSYMQRDGVQFERVGSNIRCSSPFRVDKTPSFFVYPEGRWYDFGTKENGDIIKYVMKRDRCEFMPAITLLANSFGIETFWGGDQAATTKPEERTEIDEEIRRMTERYAVFDALTEAINYWHKILPSKVREHLNNHYGITDDTIEKLKICYAHGEVYDHLVEGGYSREMIVKTGLFIEKPDPVCIFQNRIIFPYWHRGQVVYMIGRQTEWTDTSVDYEKPKYKKLQVNSETKPYISKYIQNDVFYNEDVCYQKLEYVVITEGVTDCISAMQIEEPCISPVTVRFKKTDIPKLIELVKRSQARIVYICNDADLLDDGRKPGEEGALSTAVELIRSGFDVRICELPRPAGVSKVDLNEFLRERGETAKTAFDTVRDKAKRFAQYMLDEIPDGLEGQDLEDRLMPLFELLGNATPIVKEPVAEYIRKRFKIPKATVHKYINRFKPKTDSVANDNENAEAPKSIPPPKVERIRGEVFEEIDYYFTLNKTGGTEVISNFVLRPKKHVRVEGAELLVADIIVQGQEKVIEDFVFPKRAWTSRREFISALATTRIVWGGTDDNISGLLMLLNKGGKVQVTEGTQTLGYDDSDGIKKIVFPNGVLYEDRFVPLKEAEFTYVATSQIIENRFKYIAPSKENDVRGLASYVLPRLLKLNTPKVIMPILGWFFAAPYKPLIMRKTSHFPLLMVWGTKNSGKTSILRDIFWPLLGCNSNRTEPYSCTDTTFTMLRTLSSTNSFPLVFDEHKPSDMGKHKADQLHRLMRRIYGGEVEQRGRSDLSIQSTILSAPWCVAGESPPEDPATLERLIQVCPSPEYLENNREARSSFGEIYAIGRLNELAISYLQFVIQSPLFEQQYEQTGKMTTSLLKQCGLANKIPEGTRFHDNLTVFIFGILSFATWATSLGITLPEIDLKSSVIAIVSELFQVNVFDDSEPVRKKNSLDVFLDDVYDMIALNELINGEHYILDRQRSCPMLFLAFSSVHALYKKHKMNIGSIDSTGGKRALKLMCHENMISPDGYIQSCEVRKPMQAGMVRCVAIALNKVPKSMEISALLEPRSDFDGQNN